MKSVKLIFTILLFMLASTLSCGPAGVLGASSGSYQAQIPANSNVPDRIATPPKHLDPNRINQKTLAFTKTLAKFSYQRLVDDKYYIIRYQQNSTNINRNYFIDLLNKQDRDGADFRELFNSSIADLPLPSHGNNGYQLQLPVIRVSVKDEPIYLLAIGDNIAGGRPSLYNNYLVHCAVAPLLADMRAANYQTRFWQIFGLNMVNPLLFSSLAKNPMPLASIVAGAVVFQGGDIGADPEQIMVSPCPSTNSSDHNDDLSVHHIYAFSKKASEVSQKPRLHALWYAVGQAARQMFDGHNPVQQLIGGRATRNSLFISTHGQGVRYLHVRVEDNPRYYHQRVELRDDASSKNYFLKFFPD